MLDASIKDILLAFIIHDKYIYLLFFGATALVAHGMLSKEEKSTKCKKEYAKVYFIIHFKTLLAIIFMIACFATYSVIVLTLGRYAKDLLEGTAFSFLELPVFGIIVLCVIMGSVLIYKKLSEWLKW
jgi:branched-subunit amino acid permease